MATSFFLRFTSSILFISAVSAAGQMESTQPTLSLSPTEDLHIMCNMADFDPENPPHRVEAMQILASSDEEETKPQSVLATLDYSRGPSASSFLKNSGLLFKVTGNPGKELEWWLQVAFVGVGPQEYANYMCKVLHYGDARQVGPTVWDSPVISYLPGFGEPVRKVGFEMSVRRGLDLLCEYVVRENDAVSRMTLEPVSSNTMSTSRALTAWSKDGSETCHPRVLCLPRKFIRSYFALSAHLLNLTCDEAGLYECRVDTKQAMSLASELQEFKLDECKDIESTTENNELNSTTVAGDQTERADTVIPVTVVVVIVVLMVIMAVIAFVFCCLRRKNRQGHYRVHEETDGNEKDLKPLVQVCSDSVAGDITKGHVPIKDSGDRKEGPRCQPSFSSPPRAQRIDVEVHDIANFPQSENPRMLDERDDSPGAVEMDSGPQAPAAQPLAKAELPDEDDDVSNAEVCDDVVNALNPSIATN